MSIFNSYVFILIYIGKNEYIKVMILEILFKMKVIWVFKFCKGVNLKKYGE